jgi:hypothetical protein
MLGIDGRARAIVALTKIGQIKLSCRGSRAVARVRPATSSLEAFATTGCRIGAIFTDRGRAVADAFVTATGCAAAGSRGPSPSRFPFAP